MLCMNSDEIKKEIDERVGRFKPKDERDLPKPGAMKKEMEEIDNLTKTYIKTLKLERRNALKEYYDYKKHGFRKVFHRSLTRNSPGLSPVVAILVISVFVLIIMRGIINA